MRKIHSSLKPDTPLGADCRRRCKKRRNDRNRSKAGRELVDLKFIEYGLGTSSSVYG